LSAPEPQPIAAQTLVGDIGATNARFGLLDAAAKVDRIRVRPCSDYVGLAEAIEDYLDAVRHDNPEPRPFSRPRAAALAVAASVEGDHVAFINQHWFFSQTSLKSRLNLDRLLIVNDFGALAAGAPHLPSSDLRWIGGGVARDHYVPKAMIGVLGPGTGLGVGGVFPVDRHWVALTGEGGHVSLAAGSEREGRVLEAMRRRFGHASAERALSGRGLVNLYQILADIDGAIAQPYAPAEVTEMAISGGDAHCREALDMFADMLGTEAGDLALTLGAKGGIYVGGGIVPKLGKDFPAQRFRRRFEEKGRLYPYIADIPTFIILHQFPAFVGLAALLRGGSTLAVPLD
jgi:glucokinase